MTESPPSRARRRPQPGPAVAVLCALALFAPAASAAGDDPRPAGAALIAPLSAEEFRAFAEGWTLHFELQGAPFGAESFRSGGETLWRPAGGVCTPGFWAAVGPDVCFFYGDASACWSLWRDGGGVVARSVPDGEMEVRVSRRDRAALDCGEDLLSLRAPARPAS